ncbi:MAG: Hsp33 family molecular chaperone HslO [Gammaproteobacteria bacterium]
MDVRGLHRFLFDGIPVRGAAVRITSGWQEALRRRAAVGAFAAPVRALIGEMTAAGMLMHATIKFDGALVLQVHGDGPVKLAVAEVRSDLSFRATAKVVAEVAADARLPALANVHGGGRCAITLDPRNRPPGTQPYQGVVPLFGDRREDLLDFSSVIEHYMLQSEQLDTKMILAANDDVVAGLLLQRMPAAGLGNLAAGRDEDLIGVHEDFNRLAMLASTLTRDELLALDVDTLLHRLFWQERVQRFEAMPTRFACSCGRERVQQMLRALGRDEVDDILAEQGGVEIGCDFCGAQYRFDAVDAAALFTPAIDHPPASTTLQ